MAAETLTATRAAATFPLAAHGLAGNVKAAWGTYNVPGAVEDGDIFEMCRIPKGATVLMGWFYGADLDTGTETLDMDIGWAGNGVDEANPDGFGNLGVLTGDAVTGIIPEASLWYPFGGVLRTAGPKTFGADTIIQIEANAAADAGHTGQITVVVLYTLDA